MVDPKTIELVPGQNVKPTPFFETPEKYEEFRRKFVAEVKPLLDRQREARQLSEADAKR